MDKIVGFLIVLAFIFLGLPLIGIGLNWFLPGTEIKEVFFFFPKMFWMIFKQFFLEDTLNSYGLYIVIAIVLTCAGVYISKKTEKMIWLFISLIMAIVALITGQVL